MHIFYIKCGKNNHNNLEFGAVDLVKAHGKGLLQDELLLVANAADVAQGVKHLGVVKLGHRKSKGWD